MKAGDRVICKYDYKPLNCKRWITKDKEYTVYLDKNNDFYIIDDENQKNDIILTSYFFYSKQESTKILRKKKLNKINESR